MLHNDLLSKGAESSWIIQFVGRFTGDKTIMKRVLIWAILLNVTTALFSTGDYALSLGLVPSSQSVALGSPASIAINITGLGSLSAPSLGTFDLDLAFNPAILSLTNVAYGDPVLGDQIDLFNLGSLTATTPGSGTVNLFELSFDDIAGLNNLRAASFTLATLTFNTVGAGSSPLAFTVNALGDASGDPLTASFQKGSVTVEGTAVIPELSSFLLCAVGLAGLALVRGRSWTDIFTG